MTDICLVIRTGPKMDAALSKTLFSMAQYMLEADLSYLSFEGVSRIFTATMRTDFKIGRQDSKSGMIFHTLIEYPDNDPTETIFLAERLENWREILIEKWEPQKLLDTGADPRESWKN